MSISIYAPQPVVLQHSCRTVPVDWMASFCAASCVSPAVGIIDRAFTQNAAGTHTIRKSVFESLRSLFFRPHQYFRKPDFWLLCTVYSATYGSANSFDSYYKYVNTKRGIENASQKSATQELVKILGVSGVNTLGCIWKDKMFAQMCRPTDNIGKGAASAVKAVKPPRMPAIVYAIWFVRDSTVIWASFTFPSHIAKIMHEKFGFNEDRSFLAAQFLGPVFSMTWATPLHLIGLDLYNHPNNNLRQRMQFLRQKYVASMLTKMIRIVPPFAIGPACNKYFREYFQYKFLEENGYNLD